VVVLGKKPRNFKRFQKEREPIRPKRRWGYHVVPGLTARREAGALADRDEGWEEMRKIRRLRDLLHTSALNHPKTWTLITSGGSWVAETLRQERLGREGSKGRSPRGVEGSDDGGKRTQKGRNQKVVILFVF